MDEVFNKKLDTLAKDILKLAVAKEFEEQAFRTRIDGKDTGGNTELTVDVYNKFKRLDADPKLTKDKVGLTEADGESSYYAVPGSEVWKLKHTEMNLDEVERTIKYFGRSNVKELHALLEKLKDVPNKLCMLPEWMDSDKGKPRNKPTRSVNSGKAEMFLPDFQNLLADNEAWSGATKKVYTAALGGGAEYWKRIVRSDYILAEKLVSALEAQLSVFVTTRESIVNIGNRTKEALRTCGEPPSDGSGNTAGLRAVLSITAAIAIAALAVGATVASGGGATPVLSVTGTLVSGANSVIGAALTYAAAPTDSPQTGGGGDGLHIGGAKARDVLNSMFRAISELVSKYNEQEREIARVVTENYNEVVPAEVRKTCELTFENNHAGLTTADVRGSNLKANLPNLRVAALKELPEAARVMLEANQTLASIGDGNTEFWSEYIGATSPAREPWTALRDALQDFTGNNGAKMKQAGQVLFGYLQSVGSTDGKNAADLYKTDPRYSGKEHNPISDKPSPEPRPTKGAY